MVADLYEIGLANLARSLKQFSLHVLFFADINILEVADISFGTNTATSDLVAEN